MTNFFKKYNIIKYNRQIHILFMIVLLLFLIHLYYYNLSENYKENFTEILGDKNIILKKQNLNLIQNYKIYNEELKYYLNKENEYYVKDTNKDYGKYILNISRNVDYYKNKIYLLQFPIYVRFENDGYYIDYNLQNTSIQNKVYDFTWDDYDMLNPNTIINIYSFEQEYLNNLKVLLKEYDYLYFQLADVKTDIIYDNSDDNIKLINNINNYIINSIIENIFNDIKNYLEKEQNNNTNYLQKYNNYSDLIKKDININDLIKKDININDLIKKDIDIKSSANKIYTELSDKIYIEVLTNIYKILITKLNNEQIITLIKSNKIQIFFKDLGLENILNSIIKNNIILNIETRDEKYIFIYNKDDVEGKQQLINLFKYLNNKEHINNFSDKIEKNLRYFKIPINVLRIVIKYQKYLRLF